MKCSSLKTWNCRYVTHARYVTPVNVKLVHGLSDNINDAALFDNGSINFLKDLCEKEIKQELFVFENLHEFYYI